MSSSPTRSSTVASRVDGIVDTVNVERGDFIEAGQVLVQLDSGVEAAAVEAARARATANAEIEANSVSVEFAKRRHERLHSLFMEAAISSDQMDEMTTETDLSLLQLQRALESRRIAELELARSEQILKRHTIYSPVDGVVVQRYLATGESTEDQPILRVAQIDPLRVEVIVPVSAFGALELGQMATVFPEAPREGAFPAVVTVVDRVADAASGTFRVRLSMPNPDHEVPSGLNCRVRFNPIKSAPATRTVNAVETQTPAATNAAVVQRVTAEQKAAPHCGTIGPFESEADADRVSTALDRPG